jgi:hypothetical protein
MTAIRAGPAAQNQPAGIWGCLMRAKFGNGAIHSALARRIDAANWITALRNHPSRVRRLGLQVPDDLR